MLKAKLLRAIATGATGLVLVAGTGAAYATQNHNRRGHDDRKDGSSLEIDNDNNVTVNNTTTQAAATGEAKVIAGRDNGCKKDNHQEFRRDRRDHKNDCDDNEAVLGDATTGDASNSSTSSVSVSVSNDPCSCIADNDGHGSSKVDIDNDNDVTVNNTTTQAASSGDATVYGGSGNATTGNASNTSSSSVSVTVSN